VLSIFNPPRNFRIPNQIRALASPPLTSPKLAKSLRPFSAAPEQLVANRSRNGAQEIQREGWEGEGVAAAFWGWTYSKCSNNELLDLVYEGLLQGKNLVNWRPSFRQLLPMENVDEIVSFYHFSERGLALPTCSFFRGLLYFYGLELHHLNPNSIATLLFSSTFAKLSLELNPIGIFSAIFSG
jgi:hypothetical protein